MKRIVLFINRECNHYYGIEQFLLDNGVIFEERDISKDETAIDQLKEKEIMTVPVLFIDDKVVIGFNRENINKFLNK